MSRSSRTAISSCRRAPAGAPSRSRKRSRRIHRSKARWFGRLRAQVLVLPGARHSSGASSSIAQDVSATEWRAPSKELKLLRAERVALPGIAALQPDPEPAHALGTRAMGEAVRHDPALRLALQAVVADRRGGGQRLLDVAVVDHLAATGGVGAVGPDAGKAVGLQLDPHRQGIGVALAHALLHLLGLGADAQKVLDVMADLMGDHVGLRELAGHAKAALQVVEEGEVEIDPLVGRAIERSHRRLADAAFGARGVAVEHQLGLAILPAELPEGGRPDVLGALQHARHELGFGVAGGLLGLLAGGGPAGLRRGGLIARGAAAQQGERIGAEDQGDDDEGHEAQAALEDAASAARRDGDAAHAAVTAAATTEITAVAAAILDVAAFVAVHLHNGSPGSRSSRDRLYWGR